MYWFCLLKLKPYYTHKFNVLKICSEFIFCIVLILLYALTISGNNINAYKIISWCIMGLILALMIL